MKRKRRNSTLTFALAYESRFASLKKVALVAEDAIRESLAHLNLELHAISARAKDPSSAVAKVRRKRYSRPWHQLTDQVGARVIAYYPEDVDKISTALQGGFEVDLKRSPDKRKALQTRQFGYRSVHLLVRLGKRLPSDLQPRFGKLWLEVQVRSILEHAWAEIEHEIVYKGGTTLPDALLRRFGALAGALEILDTQFSHLRLEREKFIEKLVKQYENGGGLGERLDAARLVALLEAFRPEAPGWRASGALGRRFPRHSDAACADALAAAGLKTGRAVLRKLGSAECRRAVAIFAAANGIEPARVSHLALVVLVCSVTSKRILEHYPELLRDQTLLDAVGLDSLLLRSVASRSLGSVSA